MNTKEIDIYQSNWSWGPTMDKHLKEFTHGLFTLNFPCGKSTVGDVRVDILPELKPDVIADLKHPPFRPGVFEVVICDPPFSIFNRFRWLLDLKDLTSKYFLLSTPKLSPRFKGFTRKVIWTSVKDKLFFRPWILYTRKKNLPFLFRRGRQEKLNTT